MTASGASLLREPRFRRFWMASTVSTAGSDVTALVLPLIAVTSLHASASQVSALTALVWAPHLLGVFAGTWVDRRPRPGRLLTAADLARAAILASLPVAALLHAVTLPQLYVVVVSTGIASVVFGTALPRLFVQLVGPDQFGAANGLLFTSNAVVDVVAPAAGGVLAQVIGAPATVGVDVVSFVVSAVLRRGIPTVAEVARATEESIGVRLRGGLHVLLRDPLLRACLGSATTVNLFGFFVAGGLTVLFARRVLDLAPATIGLALALGATGGVLGAALAPRVCRRIGSGHTVVLGAVVFPLSTLITPLAAGPPLARAMVFGAAEFVSGLGVMLFDVPINAIQAAAIPDRLRSRVTGAFGAVNYGVRPVGALVGGACAGALGLRLTFVVAGLGGMLSALWLVFSPVRSVHRVTELAA